MLISTDLSTNPEFHNVMPSVDNPIGALQELSQASGGHPTPLYVLQEVSGESHCPHFTYEASWAELRAVGEGSSKVLQSIVGTKLQLSFLERSQEGCCSEFTDISEER